MQLSSGKHRDVPYKGRSQPARLEPASSHAQGREVTDSHAPTAPKEPKSRPALNNVTTFPNNKVVHTTLQIYYPDNRKRFGAEEKMLLMVRRVDEVVTYSVW